MMIKSCIAEFIGTFVLVFFGCGTAMTVGCDAAAGSGYVLTAAAFGLAVMAMAYSVGSISGGHFNPAVTVGFIVAKKMNIMDAIAYIGSQLFGGLLASAILCLLFVNSSMVDKTGTLASNTLDGVGGNIWAGLAIEVIMTCVFMLVILFMTSKPQNGKMAGAVIGLTLTLIHILGIGMTGTSVNPARSIGPAIIAALSGAARGPITQLWIFIFAPCIGAAIAAGIYRYMNKPEKA